MKDFLSTFMRKNKNAPEEALERQSDGLPRSTCKQLLRIAWERSPFTNPLGSKCQPSMTQSWLLSQNTLIAVPCDIQQRYKQLLEDDDFIGNTRYGTTDVDTVQQRFAVAKSVLFS